MRRSGTEWYGVVWDLGFYESIWFLKFLLKYCLLYEIEITKILLVYSSSCIATLLTLSLNRENQTRMVRDMSSTENFFKSALQS
jgi:hypothetical protein